MGRKAIDLTEKRFGYLTVISRNGSDKYSEPMWLCRCDCGKEKNISGAVLRRGDSKSCGCLKGSAKRNLFGVADIMKHSRKNDLYNRWGAIIYRCTHEAYTNYEYYGEKGISVCREWIESFEVFAEWALSNGYQKGLEIDRIDSNKDYSPENCRWITHKMNSRNRGARKASKSGCAGVTFRLNPQKTSGKWRSNIVVDGKNISLGHYENINDAIAARKAAELKYWGFQIGT